MDKIAARLLKTADNRQGELDFDYGHAYYDVDVASE